MRSHLSSILSYIFIYFILYIALPYSSHLAAAEPKSTSLNSSERLSSSKYVQPPKKSFKSATDQQPTVPVNVGRLSDTLISIVPGVIVHGAGHWYRGDITSGKNIFILEGLSLLTLVSAYFIDTQVNAPPQVSSATEWLYHVGSVVFVMTWLTDVIGSFRGDQPARRINQHSRFMHVAAGYRYQADPQRSLNHHIISEVQYQGDRWSGHALFNWESGGKLAGVSGELDAWIYRRTPKRLIFPSGLKLGSTLKRWAWLREDLVQWLVVPFLEAHLSLETISSGLKSFSFYHRVGFGWERFDLAPISDIEDESPALINYPLILQSGILVKPSPSIKIGVSIIQDSTLDVRPLNEDHLFWAAHAKIRQSRKVSLEAKALWGEDWSMWLLVAFNLEKDS